MSTLTSVLFILLMACIYTMLFLLGLMAANSFVARRAAARFKAAAQALHEAHACAAAKPVAGTRLS